MWIVFLCLLIFFVLGLIFSKIKITIEKVKFNEETKNLKIKVGFFLFGIIKIFGVKLNETGIEILGKTITYEKILKNKKIKQMLKKDFKKINFKELENIFHIKIAKFTLKIGIENIFLTVFLVTVISVLLSEFVRRKLEMFNISKTKYRILPEYNRNEIDFQGKTLVSVKTRALKKLYI